MNFIKNPAAVFSIFLSVSAFAEQTLVSCHYRGGTLEVVKTSAAKYNMLTLESNGDRKHEYARRTHFSRRSLAERSFLYESAVQKLHLDASRLESLDIFQQTDRSSSISPPEVRVGLDVNGKFLFAFVGLDNILCTIQKDD